MFAGCFKDVLIGLAFRGEAAPLLAGHVDDVIARFVKETALTKPELFPDLVPYK